MNIKSLTLICFSFFLINANAQKLTILECVGKTEVGTSNIKNFLRNSYNKVGDTELLITIKDELLTVDGDEFKKIEMSFGTRDEEAKIDGNLEAKETYFDGYYTFEQGSEDKQNYIYSRRRITLNRLNGDFTYSYSFYTKNIIENWLGKLTKTKLTDGYLDRQIEGKCKQSKKKQLF